MIGFIKRHGGISLILAAFVALGVTYSVVTPIFEAPDEPWHYYFIKHLADGHGLPVQDPKNIGPWRQEGSQPPLYYALGALATFWIDADDIEELLWFNPQANPGQRTSLGNKNLFVHTERESFPYRGATLAVHLVRLFSVLMGAGTVLLTYLIALEIFPECRALALGAAALNAFIPQFLFISGAVNNDNLVTLLSTLALFLIIRLLRNSQFVTRHWSLLGFVLGLAALSKLSALVLFPLAAIAVAVAAYRRRSLGPFVKGFAVALSVAFLVAGWWYARNWVLYGDPTGLKAMLAIAGRREELLTNLAELWGEFRGLRMSFWALFGWCNVIAAPLSYKVLDAIILLGMGGMLLGGFRRKKAFASPVLWIPALWIAIVMAGLIRWASFTKEGLQGRLIFPAISAISIFLFWGLSQWVGRQVKSLTIAVGGAFFLFALICPFRYIAPAYDRLPITLPIPLGKIRLASANFGDVRLTGAFYQGEVKADSAICLALRWQLAQATERAYQVAVILWDEGGRRLSGADVLLLNEGGLSTERWAPGEEAINYYIVPVPLGTPPLSYRITVGVYDAETLEGLDLLDEAGNPVGKDFFLGEVKVTKARDFERDPYGTRRHLSLETLDNPEIADGLALEGFAVDEVWPARMVGVTLRWRALHEGLPRYVPRLRLRLGDAILAEVGSALFQQRYPTTEWAQGEVVFEQRDLIYPPMAGQAVLEVEVEGKIIPLTEVELERAELLFEAPPMQHEVGVRFGDFAELLGYDLDRTEATTEEKVRLTLYWRAINKEPLATSYTVFTHLLSEEGKLIGQHDGIPGGGKRPTTSWVAGEVIVDVHEMEFKDLGYRGRALIEVGLYESLTIERVLTEDGRDHLILPSEVAVEGTS